MIIKAIQIPSDFNEIFTSFQNIIKSSDITRPILCKMYWDSGNKTLVATNGRCVLTWKVPAKIAGEFTDTPCFMEYNNGTALLHDRYCNAPNATEYVDYRRVIPNTKNMVAVKMDTPSCKKKNRAFAACNYVSFITDKLFSPDQFEHIKGVISGFTVIHFSKDLDTVVLTQPDDFMTFTVICMTVAKPKIKDGYVVKDNAYRDLKSLLQEKQNVRHIGVGPEDDWTFSVGNEDFRFTLKENGNYITFYVLDVPIFVFCKSVWTAQAMYVAVSGVIKYYKVF